MGVCEDCLRALISGRPPGAGTEVWSTEPPACDSRSLLMASGEVKIFYTVFFSLGDIIKKSKLCSDSTLGENMVEFSVLLLNCLIVLILRDPFL